MTVFRTKNKKRGVAKCYTRHERNLRKEVIYMESMERIFVIFITIVSIVLSGLLSGHEKCLLSS